MMVRYIVGLGGRDATSSDFGCAWARRVWFGLCIKVFNPLPEASIISHDDGDEVKEATEVLFRGMGSDPDHGKTDLEASWQVDSEVICDWYRCSKRARLSAPFPSRRCSPV